MLCFITRRVLEKDWMCAAVPRILAAQHRLQAVRRVYSADTVLYLSDRYDELNLTLLVC